VLSATGAPVALANGFVFDMVSSWVFDMVIFGRCETLRVRRSGPSD
jgi:hypothetical protein